MKLKILYIIKTLILILYHDKLKKQYCEQKHISLLILSYKDIKNNSFQNKILEFIQTTQI